MRSLCLPPTGWPYWLMISAATPTAIIVSSEDDAEAREAARQIGNARPNLADVLILGPAPAPLSLLRGRHRHRLLINARRSAELQVIIRAWLDPLRFPSGVRVALDIDPYSFV